jgi:Putative Flp pilus-assembly TadE/G-like
MRNRSAGRRGQALLLVTFALFAMCGLLGLAVDLGWGYFVKKSAQAAADAGALGAANAALTLVQQNGTLLPKWGSPGVLCPTGSPPDPVAAGCVYAQQPGFAGSTTRITIAAEGPTSGVPSPACATSPAPVPPTVPGVTTACYWVTTRATQVIPQLFSAVLGNPTGISSARATAAVIDVIVNGSLITLGRSGDPAPMNTDVSLTGSGGLTLADGLWAAANSNSSPQGIQATGGQINGPILEISPATNPNAGGTNVFAALPDGSQFGDPTAFKGVIQPPLPTSALNTYAVLNGNLNGAIYQVSANNLIVSAVPLSTGTLPPGNYFPGSDATNNPPLVGDPVTINPSVALTTAGTVTFSNSGNFGAYFFYGGLTVTGTMNMGPGEYVVVGRGPNGALTVNGVLQDPNSAFDGGQLIIVTGTTSQLSGTNNQNSNLYPGLMTQLNSNIGLTQMLNSTSGAFGQTTFNTPGGGTNDATGINTANIIGSISSYLSAFNGVVFWQDQANSMILYNPTPVSNPIQTSASCGGGNTINIPCPTPSSYTISPNINLNTNGDLGLKGVFYQPRGASLTANGNVTGNLQVITGSFISSGGSLNLQDPPIRLKRRTVALIE